MNCATCHQLLPSDADFCPNCGAQVRRAAIGPTQRLESLTVPTCPKCGNAMQRGFIPDEYRDRNEISVWVPGVPERSPSNGAIELADSQMWRIATYRCRNCGYLESYATDEIGAS
jgi:predicted RNA-binding Zn-ribbon protein involved in translation (DUF1610 family)